MEQELNNVVPEEENPETVSSATEESVKTEKASEQNLRKKTSLSFLSKELKLKQPAQKEQKTTEMPSMELIESERKRLGEKKRFRSALTSTIYALITVSAVAVLVATLLLPVLQIYGNSMTPTVSEGNIVISAKTSYKYLEQGDIISFYYNNKILVKRVIALPGDWVDIDDDGTVYVNGSELYEPYVQQKALGDCDIELPFMVPDGKVFVMGDHRSVSQDSRLEAIGCVAEEQIVGRIIFKVWPLADFGSVE